MKTASMKYALIAVLGAWGLLSGTALAQGGSLTPDKLEITGDYEPNLSELEKPSMETPAIDNKVDTQGIEYQEKDIKAETEYQPLKARIPKPPKVKMPALYNNLVKVGFGRFASPLARVYLNTGRNLNGNAGLDLSHDQSWSGYTDYAEFRNTQGGLKGEYYVKDHTMKAKLRLQNRNYFYFGDSIVPNLINLSENPRDSIRQTYTRMLIEASLARNYDPEVVHYDVGLRFKGYFDRYKDRDIHLSVLPQLGWKITDHFGADVAGNLTFSNASFDSVTTSRIFMDFTPTVSFNLGNLSAQGGLKVNTFSDTTTTFAAFPILKAAYQVVPEKFSVSAGLQGEMRYLQYYDLIEENPFLARQADIRPSSDRVHLYAGIDGQVAKHLNFSVRGYTKKVKNQLIYFNPEGGSRFQMLYDSSFGVTGLEAALIYNKDDKIRAGVKGDFRSFNTSNISHNFNMPNTRVDLWASYNFAKKVWVATEVYLWGSRVMSLAADGSEINQGITADVNLSADYRFSKRISVFLELNNILGNNWQRWHGYQERPFDVKGGVTLAF